MTRYENTDWEQTNAEIAARLGISPQSVGVARRRITGLTLRAVLCEWCGALFARTKAQKFCCAECRWGAKLKRKREGGHRNGALPTTGHPCADCGATVQGRSIRCGPCKARRNREVWRKFERKKHGWGSSEALTKCDLCECTIPVGNNGRAKYCEGCRHRAVRIRGARHRASQLKRSLEDQINQLKNSETP
jgi:hypothetical protein